jgi:hypothetical protein
MRSAGGQIHLPAAAYARIGHAALKERIDRGSIFASARGLADRPIVPIKAQKSEVFDEKLIRTRLDAGTVEIFDAQEDSPARSSGQKPVDQKRAGVSQVKRAGGRGS